MSLKLSPQLTKGLLIAVLAVLVAIAALPNYVGGNWPWTKPPEVQRIEQLKAVSEAGVSIANWQTVQSQTVEISGHDWFLMELQSPNPTPLLATATLLLRPQPWHTEQPEVEWIDLMGSQGWQIESPQSLRLSSPTTDDLAVQARFFRGRNERGTFAVLQWYAWSDGGHYSPSHWFVADQIKQWRDRQRLPWVAVCLITAMEPLSSLEPYEASMSDLASQVQASLQSGPLASNLLSLFGTPA
ncbi:cyanoexosortase B system-associated protein [Almyronema epifaneia]|uniref:Cyanoexosortase B system-associated protein n=1 Tax=Almyronema epifaneia S1 TaxID=2991925 RepID=A0ABW6IE50_9CYAN